MSLLKLLMNGILKPNNLDTLHNMIIVVNYVYRNMGG